MGSQREASRREIEDHVLGLHHVERLELLHLQEQSH